MLGLRQPEQGQREREGEKGRSGGGTEEEEKGEGGGTSQPATLIGLNTVPGQQVIQA